MSQQEIPKVIYLQLYGPDGPEDFDEDIHYEGVTWCVDKVYDSDIVYHTAPCNASKAVDEIQAWILVSEKEREDHSPEFMYAVEQVKAIIASKE